MPDYPDDLVHEILAGALQALDAATADLLMLVSLARNEPLARDAATLAEAVEEEAEALRAAAARWQERRS